VISVLITTYNYGSFVEDALDSVLSQNFQMEDVEIVVVDDGSTDDTAERVRKYGARVRYHYKSNGGQASALNLGFAKSSGEIVCLLDADDYFRPDKLSHVADAFAREPTLGMVYHRLQQWDMNTGLRTDFPFVNVSGDLRYLPDQFSQFVPQPTSGICLRRSALHSLLPIPEGVVMLADHYLVALLPLLHPLRAVPKTLGVYRHHGSNSYWTSDEQACAPISGGKLRMWVTVYGAIGKWLSEHRCSYVQPNPRTLFDRWFGFEQDLFRESSPSRLRSFLFLARQNSIRRPTQSWRRTLYNYLASFAALAFGYRKRKLIFEFLDRVLRALQLVWKKSGTSSTIQNPRE
jgi:glycosyltransferase involved in cell wall biosynthesis